MSIKSKVLAAAATLTLVGGVGTVGVLTAGSASAGTPSCGPDCINLFNKDFAGFNGGAASPVDVFRQGERTGQPIILFRSSNSDPAMDWSASFQGTVNQLVTLGLLSPLTGLHYGNDFAFENAYTPFGVFSGLCLGVAATAFQNEGVTLQPCGVSGRTIWIVDSEESFFHNFPGVPLINGSNTNFSHPFVLTYPANANPTDIPRVQLRVTNLTGSTQPGGHHFPVISTVNSSQLWIATFGVLP
jgi:hypothetical protein